MDYRVFVRNASADIQTLLDAIDNANKVGAEMIRDSHEKDKEIERLRSRRCATEGCDNFVGGDYCDACSRLWEN